MTVNVSEMQQLDFHCLSTEAHQAFLKRHSQNVLQLSEHHTIRVLTHEETTKLSNATTARQAANENTDDRKAQALDISQILHRLDTRWLGHILLHAPRLHSTQDVMRRGTVDWAGRHGWAVTTSLQQGGRGRRGTTWTSPPGSTAVTIALSLDSRHAANLIFLQYISALAVTAAADKTAWCKADTCIKWPNDVYAPDGKVAGVLCEATFDATASRFDVLVGVGMNVCNAAPPACLLQDGWSVDAIPFAREEFLAAFLNAFEELYDEFCIRGFEGRLRERYLQRWMHSGQTVRMDGVDGPEAVVTGLAPNGWVRVFRNDWQAFQDLPPESTSLDVVRGVLMEKCEGTRHSD